MGSLTTGKTSIVRYLKSKVQLQGQTQAACKMTQTSREAMEHLRKLHKLFKPSTAKGG